MTPVLRCLFGLMLLILAASCGKPVADFSWDGSQHIAPAQITFINQSKKSDSYRWDFGDGTTSEEVSPAHVYRGSGNYTVQLSATKNGKTHTTTERIQVTAPLDCLVEISTDYGTMLVRLSNATPQHRDNFIKLAETGYLDGTLFHRVIDGFMIQGGDPDSRNAQPGQPLGAGGPDYTLPAEFVDSLVHVKGALAAARQGDQVNPEKRSSGSQFYIVHGQPLTKSELDNMEARKGIRYTKEQRDKYTSVGGTPFLDREYTVFGQVIKGLEVIDKIAAAEKDAQDRPQKDIKMKVIVIK